MILVALPFVWTKQYQEWYCRGGIIAFIGIGSSLYMIPLAIRSWILMKISQMADTKVTDLPSVSPRQSGHLVSFQTQTQTKQKSQHLTFSSNSNTSSEYPFPFPFQKRRGSLSPRETLRISSSQGDEVALEQPAPTSRRNSKIFQQQVNVLTNNNNKIHALKCTQRKTFFALCLLMIFPVAIVIVNIQSVIMKEEKISFFENILFEKEKEKDIHLDIFLESICSSNLLEWKYAWMSFCLLFWVVWASFLIRCNEQHAFLEQVRHMKLGLCLIISICSLLLLNDFFMTRVRKILSFSIPLFLLKVLNRTEENNPESERLLHVNWSLFELEEFSYFARSYILIIGIPICQTLFYAQVIFARMQYLVHQLIRKGKEEEEGQGQEEGGAMTLQEPYSSSSSPPLSITLPFRPKHFSSRASVKHKRNPSFPSENQRVHHPGPAELNPLRASQVQIPPSIVIVTTGETIQPLVLLPPSQNPPIEMEEIQEEEKKEISKQSSSSKHRRMALQLPSNLNLLNQQSSEN